MLVFQRLTVQQCTVAACFPVARLAEVHQENDICDNRCLMFEMFTCELTGYYVWYTDGRRSAILHIKISVFAVFCFYFIKLLGREVLYTLRLSLFFLQMIVSKINQFFNVNKTWTYSVLIFRQQQDECIFAQTHLNMHNKSPDNFSYKLLQQIKLRVNQPIY